LSITSVEGSRLRKEFDKKTLLNRRLRFLLIIGGICDLVHAVLIIFQIHLNQFVFHSIVAFIYGRTTLHVVCEQTV